MKPITSKPSNDASAENEPSLPARAALLLIRAYKLFISPYFAAGSCRFLPSCSDYAAEAVARHGLVRGGSLAVRRFMRCQPLCAAGHDPVPQKL